MCSKSSKSVDIRADCDESSNPSASAVVDVANVDGFLQEEELSKNILPKEIYEEYTKAILDLKEIIDSASDIENVRSNVEIEKKENKRNEKEGIKELQGSTALRNRLETKEKLKIEKLRKYERDKLIAKLKEKRTLEIIAVTYRLRDISRTSKHQLKSSVDIAAEWQQKIKEKKLKLQDKLSEKKLLENDINIAMQLQFAAELKEIKNKKKRIEISIKKLRKRLDTVESTLKNILEVTATELENSAGPPAQIYYPGFAEAQKLPAPLRKIYANLRSYTEAWNDEECDISANIISTKVFYKKTIDHTSDNGANSKERKSKKKKHKKHRHSSGLHEDIEEPNDESPLKEYKSSVQCILQYEGSTLILAFSYVPVLNIVKVRFQNFFPNPLLGISKNKSFIADGFLNSLFPGDNGQVNPNPVTQPLLQDMGIVDLCSAFNDSVGKPYIWAQKFAGLQFAFYPKTSKVGCLIVDFEEAKYITDVVSALKSRMKSKISINFEITMLESQKYPPDFDESLLPTGIVSHLLCIKDVPLDNISLHPDYRNLKKENIFTGECFLYKLEMERGTALLSSLVIIPPDYPLGTPVFLLFLDWKGSFNSTNNIGIRELEQEINLFFIDEIPEELKYYTLFYQVHHLCACFDIYLETDDNNVGDSIESPKEFISDKAFTQNFRGRSHSRPYKYMPSLKLFTCR